MRSAKNLVFGILAFGALALSGVPAHAQRATPGSEVDSPAAKSSPAASVHEQRMRHPMGQHPHGPGKRAQEHAMRNMASGCPMMQSGAPGEHNH
jgi:hypothetical protein